MKKWFNKMNKLQQRILLVGGLAAILSGGTITLGSIQNWGKHWFGAPGEIRDINRRLSIMEQRFDNQVLLVGQIKDSLNHIIDSVNARILDLEHYQEMSWDFDRNNSADLDDQDRYLVFDDGNVIDVDIRRTTLGDKWAFLLNHQSFPAYWSKVDGKYYILAFDGQDYLIYENRRGRHR